MRRGWLMGTFGLALIVGAAFGVALFHSSPMHARSMPAVVASSSIPVARLPEADAQTVRSVEDSVSGPMGSQEMMDAAFRARDAWTVAAGTRELILPHHLVASQEIASLVSAVAAPSVVYLVSPDHFSQGKTVFTTTDASFETPYGVLEGSPEDVAMLMRDVPHLLSTRAPFLKEHGVSGLVPFFAHAWPGVRVVPIIVRIDASLEDRQNLAQALTARLQNDPNALLVTTVDFSHDLPAEVADFHDELAQDVVSSLADLEADRVELDSSGALAVGLKVARSLGLGDVTIHAHSNSLRIVQAKIAQSSTSHLLVSFAPGSIQDQQELSLLFVGDMMFDRTVATRMKKAGTTDYPFDLIHGNEDRFFRGQDLVIGNLEGPVSPQRVSSTKAISFAFDPSILTSVKKMGFDAVSQANNHTLDQGRANATVSRNLISAAGIVPFGDEYREDAASSLAILERRGRRIALLGFNATEGPIDRSSVEKDIEAAKQRADAVVVFMHWGVEYHDQPNQTQVDLAHWLIDHGVDAVIGGHPHWMQSVETYHGKVIAYSLGNFIFDQDWSAETKLGLVVGLTLEGVSGSMTPALHLYPIKIVNSQPQLLTGDERTQRLEKLAQISDPNLKTQILDGVIAPTM